jgi:hypothetical protein
MGRRLSHKPRSVRPAEDDSVVPHNFIKCDREQAFLMPPWLREWLREDHLAWFVLDAVEEMDLDRFYADYRADGHGRAAYEPSMMGAQRPRRARAAQREVEHRPRIWSRTAASLPRTCRSGACTSWSETDPSTLAVAIPLGSMAESPIPR